MRFCFTRPIALASVTSAFKTDYRNFLCLHPRDKYQLYKVTIKKRVVEFAIIRYIATNIEIMYDRF